MFAANLQASLQCKNEPSVLVFTYALALSSLCHPRLSESEREMTQARVSYLTTRALTTPRLPTAHGTRGIGALRHSYPYPPSENPSPTGKLSNNVN